VREEAEQVNGAEKKQDVFLMYECYPALYIVTVLRMFMRW
jgi:hypothetical protein